VFYVRDWKINHSETNGTEQPPSFSTLKVILIPFCCLQMYKFWHIFEECSSLIIIIINLIELLLCPAIMNIIFPESRNSRTTEMNFTLFMFVFVKLNVIFRLLSYAENYTHHHIILVVV
jgi:hypothetical protein